jgi:hypothetical protein
LYRDVGRFLHRLDGKVSRRLDDDTSLAADPRNDRRTIFVVMAPARLTLLAASTRSAPQRLFPTSLGLALLASSVIEVIGFDCALYLAIGRSISSSL